MQENGTEVPPNSSHQKVILEFPRRVVYINAIVNEMRRLAIPVAA